MQHGACRTRSEKEVKKHVQRRKKRKRDKAAEPPEDGQEPAAAAFAQNAQDAQDDITASDLLAPLQARQTLSHANQACPADTLHWDPSCCAARLCGP